MQAVVQFEEDRNEYLKRRMLLMSATPVQAAIPKLDAGMASTAIETFLENFEF